MAWNEPGNNNKRRDPWQDGENRNLDEVLKQMKDRFGRYFGGSGFPGPLLIVLGVLGAWFMMDSWQTIDERERGVVLRFGKFERVMGSGLNMKWPRPIETVEIVETTRVRSDSAEVRMLLSFQRPSRPIGKGMPSSRDASLGRAQRTDRSG